MVALVSHEFDIAGYRHSSHQPNCYSRPGATRTPQSIIAWCLTNSSQRSCSLTSHLVANSHRLNRRRQNAWEDLRAYGEACVLYMCNPFEILHPQRWQRTAAFGLLDFLMIFPLLPATRCSSPLRIDAHELLLGGFNDVMHKT